MDGLANLAVDLSIVVPVYFNEGALATTMSSIKAEVLALQPDLCCEVIFVDDGSGDRSFDELVALQKQDPHIVKVIKLTRNFGQANALLAGFSYAKGRCVVAMSADGQDPPELINQMLQAHFDEGFHIVAGMRQGRDESYYRIFTSRLFYALMRRLSFPNMPLGGFDFVLLSRRAVDILLRNQEAYPFFQGQLLWMGLRTQFLPYRRRERKVGHSRWTFGKKLTYLLDGTMAYSFLPMRLMSGIGLIAASLGFLYAAIIFLGRLVWGNPVQGWAPLMIVVLVMGGLQMLMLGVVGEYLWRTLAQVRHRDPYIVEAVVDQTSSNESGAAA